MFGHEGVRGAGARTFSSYEDIFAAFGDVFGTGLGSIFGGFFGGGAGPRTRRTRGASLRCEVDITFEEAADGVEKTILLRRAERCENCNATGAKPGTSPRTCPACNGHGEVTRSQGFFTVRSTCPQCRGRGEIVDTPCPKCKGTGLTSQEREITVKIPQGIEDSSRLRIPGEGEPGEHGGPHGDLYCFITLKPHSFFERRGDDLFIEVPVSFAEAALGTRIEVPTLHGLRTMKVAPGTQSGTILRLRGEGFPNVHGYGQGDQLVKIAVEVPRKLSRDQQNLVKKFAEAKGKHLNPRKDEYARKLKKHYEKKKPKP
jgi:molecular chaperone DnaJ